MAGTQQRTISTDHLDERGVIPITGYEGKLQTQGTRKNREEPTGPVDEYGHKGKTAGTIMSDGGNGIPP